MPLWGQVVLMWARLNQDLWAQEKLLLPHNYLAESNKQTKYIWGKLLIKYFLRRNTEFPFLRGNTYWGEIQKNTFKQTIAKNWYMTRRHGFSWMQRDLRSDGIKKTAWNKWRKQWPRIEYFDLYLFIYLDIYYISRHSLCTSIHI